MSAAATPIHETCFRQLSAKDYHADPCAVPSLSSSIANVLDTESPLHAWTRHPRLGGVPRSATADMDAGSLAHALLLDAGKGVEVIEADDFRTKAAREVRDEARSKGLLPVLAKDYAAAVKTAAILRERFASLGIVLDGESETTALWTETASNGRIVQCRGMMDHMTLPRIWDLKSARSAKPESCRKHVESYGYAIQRAAYTSAVEKIRPEFAGRVDFVFVFFELEAPFAVTPVRLSGAFRELGARSWRRAVDRWEACLSANRWPAYAEEIIEVEPSAWALSRDMDRAIDNQEVA